MEDETTVQSIAEATTNGSDNVVEDFTSVEVLPESNADLTEDNETTEGQDETVTEETDTTTPFPIQEDNTEDYYYNENITTESTADETISSSHFPITTDTDTDETDESISEGETTTTGTVLEESTVSEILEDCTDTTNATMSVFDADKATTVNDTKEETTQISDFGDIESVTNGSDTDNTDTPITEETTSVADTNGTEDTIPVTDTSTTEEMSL